MHHHEGMMGAESLNEGKVVLCTARDCKWNDATQCVADAGIMVNFHQDHADCNTYTKNMHIPGRTPGAATF